MAFCPECGKPATAGASKCVHCGTELTAPKEKVAGGGRFKGTMMMQSAPGVATPAAAAAPAAPAVAAPAVSVTPVPAAPAASTVPKPSLKGTMVAGIAPPVAPSVAAVPPSAAAPAPAPEATRQKLAFAATQPQQAAYQLPQTPAHAEPEAKKFLPGDPMAQGQSAPRASMTHRGSDPNTAEGNKTWLYVGLGCLGMVVIGGIGVLIALRLGLAHFGK